MLMITGKNIHLFKPLTKHTIYMILAVLKVPSIAVNG